MHTTDITTTAWRTLPDGGQVPEHVFAIGDVHGMAGLLEDMLNHLEALPQLADRHLVFLGDLADRGPEGLRAIRLAWDSAARFETRTCLPGNHEITLMEAVRTPDLNAAFRWWFKTYHGHAVCAELDPTGQLISIDQLAQAIYAALPEGFPERVVNGPSHVKIGDLLLVHAGIHPHRDRAAFLAMEALAPYDHDEHWSMIRDTFLDWQHGWDPQGRGPTVVIHGHTVAANARIATRETLEALADRTRSRRRINLDMGAVFFGQLAALEAHGDRYRLHLVSEQPEYLP